MGILSLRLPDDLHAQLKEAAETECRSLTEEIVFACRRYLASLAAQGLIEIKAPTSPPAP